MTFLHLLLTRHAVADRARLGKVAIDHEWFARRCDMLTRYTLPSVRAQTVSNFRWLLFFSPEYGQEMVPVRAALASYPAARLLPLVSEWGACEQEVCKVMRSEVTTESHVISTRIDSDDVMAPDFMEIVQAQFAGQYDRTFLNFEHGYAQHGEMLTPLSDPANAFQSVIERVEDMQGILAWHHGYTHLAGERVQLQHRGRWTRIYHQANAFSV